MSTTGAGSMDLTSFVETLRAAGVQVNVQRVESEPRIVECPVCHGKSTVLRLSALPGHVLLDCDHTVVTS